MKTGRVKTDRVTMEYFCFGGGSRALIILPGLGIKKISASAHAVEAAYGCFKKDYTVYVFDRGDNLPDGYSVGEIAEDTADAIRSLGIAQADVFGASMGGMIAQSLALEHPELVRSVILGSTLSRPNDTARRMIGRWAELARSRDVKAMAREMIESLFSEKLSAQFEMIAELMFSGVTDHDFDRFMIQAEAIESFDVYDRLTEITCPVFVIGVENDKVVTADASREIAEKLNCGLYIYGDEYGHCVFDEAPDYRKRMMKWLASV